MKLRESNTSALCAHYTELRVDEDLGGGDSAVKAAASRRTPNSFHVREGWELREAWLPRVNPTGTAIHREFRRAMLPSMAPLGLIVRLCVARSTATIPNFGSKPDIHSKLSSSDQAT